jgi:hypothetical protein
MCLDGDGPFLYLSGVLIVRQVQCGCHSYAVVLSVLVDLWHLSNPHSTQEAKVSENPGVIAALKDLPIRAVPFIIFPGACGVFGEMLLRMPPVPSLPQMLASWVLVAFTTISGGLFFTKVLFGWPPMHGLELKD